jgi:hypothetical protein
MSFRRGSGLTAAFSIIATIAIFGSQQAPAAAAARAATTAPAVTAASNYTPITPGFRILDTRTGLCGGHVCHALGAGGRLTLQITGYVDPRTGNSVPAAATAVVINVTAVNGSVGSLLTVYPAGTSQPRASNLNFPAHLNLANLVTSELGSGGAVTIFNSLGTVNVLADVEGYFQPQLLSDPSGEYHPIPPLRVCDTRAGQPATTCNGLNNGQPHALGANSAVKVTVAGQPAWCSPTCTPSIPTNGTEEFAIVNLTAVAPTANTYLSVVPWSTSGCQYGGSKGAPPFSTININAGKTLANRVFVDLAINTNPINICVYNNSGKVNFIIDDNGWFGGPTAGQGEQYFATTPTRVCDTRSGAGTTCSGHPLTSAGTLNVAIAGQAGISSGALAVIANVTAVDGTASTFLTLYPSDAAHRPNTSDVNVLPHVNLPNLTAVQLSASGTLGHVNIFNAVGTINVIVDVEGWFH